MHKKVVKGSLSELFINPRQILLYPHKLNLRNQFTYHYSSRTYTTTTSRLFLGKVNSVRMGRTNDPVLIQSSSGVAENHLNPVGQHAHQHGNINQKWVSSLSNTSTNNKPVNGDSPHKLSSSSSAPANSSTPPQSSIDLNDKAMLMGKFQFLSLLLVMVCANFFFLDTTLSLDVRNKLGLRGIMPPAVDTHDTQIERCLARIRAKDHNLDK